MLHWLQTAFSTYVLHPEHGNGYQWHSGIGSDLGELTLVAALLATAKHHNCEHPRCPRLGHPHPGHGRPVCRRHFHSTEVAPSDPQ